MQVVIKIPEEVKQKIDENLNSCDLDIYDCVMLATKNGTPLSEGHGNLIDAKDLIPDADYEDGIFGAVSCQQIVEAEAIIEADSEE